jgi:hypothetical protein
MTGHLDTTAGFTLPASTEHLGAIPAIPADADDEWLAAITAADDDGHLGADGTPAALLPALPAPVDRLPYRWHPQAWAQRRVDHAHRADVAAAYLAECAEYGLPDDETQRRVSILLAYGAEAVAVDVYRRSPQGIRDSLAAPMLPIVSAADAGSIYAAMATRDDPVVEPTAVHPPGTPIPPEPADPPPAPRVPGTGRAGATARPRRSRRRSSGESPGDPPRRR